jgi:hypothetical protein
MPTSYKSPNPKRGIVDDKTANLRASNDEAWDPTGKPSANRLYLAQNQNLERVQATQYIRDLTLGYLEATEAYAKGTAKDTAKTKNTDALVRWLNDNKVKQTVARFTPEATPTFATQLRLVYSPLHDSKPVPANDDDFEREPFGTWKDAFEKMKEGDKRWPSPRPNYAIMTAQHAFNDLTNCDIPSFYHRLDDTDLLNARGQVVAVQPSPPGRQPINRPTYFPESTHGIVLQAIGQLKDDVKRNARIKAGLVAIGYRLSTKKGVNEAFAVWVNKGT